MVNGKYTVAEMAAAFLLLLLAACSNGRPESARPNIVLISIDNLGAGHMGCYGYDRDTTPFLDALAGEAVLFERLVTQETWTLPSHTSLVSSRYVGAHGTWELFSRLPEKNLVLLQEVLKDGGYLTAGFTTCEFLTPTYRFDRGFDHFKSHRVPAETLNTEILEFLRTVPDEPFFLFIHYFDVHSPFIEENPYGENFTSDEPDGTRALVKKMRSFTGKKLGELTLEEITWLEENLGVPGLKEMVMDEKSRDATITKAQLQQWALRLLQNAGPESVQYIKAAYDNGIANMDKRLSELFERLRAFPWFENTVFAVTSDHGEAFNQHPGVVGHGGLPYEELVHVPFLMLGPGLPVNERIATLAASIDIAPTLVELAEVSLPGGFQGRSLVPLLRGKGMKSKNVLVGSRDAKRLSLEDEQWKLILDMRERKVMLFDLKSPGGEDEDVSALHPEVTLKLKERLLKIEKNNQSAGAGIIRGRVELDDETRARLREMGYVK